MNEKVGITFEVRLRRERTQNNRLMAYLIEGLLDQTHWRCKTTPPPTPNPEGQGCDRPDGRRLSQ